MTSTGKRYEGRFSRQLVLPLHEALSYHQKKPKNSKTNSNNINTHSKNNSGSGDRGYHGENHLDQLSQRHMLISSAGPLVRLLAEEQRSRRCNRRAARQLDSALEEKPWYLLSFEEVRRKIFLEKRASKSSKLSAGINGNGSAMTKSSEWTLSCSAVGVDEDVRHAHASRASVEPALDKRETCSLPFGRSNNPRFPYQSQAESPRNQAQVKSKKANSSSTVQQNVTPEFLYDKALREVKARRLRVSELQAELTLADAKILKLQTECDQYGKLTLEVVGECESLDLELEQLREQAVDVLATAEQIQNREEKSRQRRRNVHMWKQQHRRDKASEPIRKNRTVASPPPPPPPLEELSSAYNDSTNRNINSSSAATFTVTSLDGIFQVVDDNELAIDCALEPFTPKGKTKRVSFINGELRIPGECSAGDASVPVNGNDKDAAPTRSNSVTVSDLKKIFQPKPHSTPPPRANSHATTPSGDYISQSDSHTSAFSEEWSPSKAEGSVILTDEIQFISSGNPSKVSTDLAVSDDNHSESSFDSMERKILAWERNFYCPENVEHVREDSGELFDTESGEACRFSGHKSDLDIRKLWVESIPYLHSTQFNRGDKMPRRRYVAGTYTTRVEASMAKIAAMRAKALQSSDEESEDSESEGILMQTLGTKGPMIERLVQRDEAIQEAKRKARRGLRRFALLVKRWQLRQNALSKVENVTSAALASLDQGNASRSAVGSSASEGNSTHESLSARRFSVLSIGGSQSSSRRQSKNTKTVQSSRQSSISTNRRASIGSVLSINSKSGRGSAGEESITGDFNVLEEQEEAERVPQLMQHLKLLRAKCRPVSKESRIRKKHTVGRSSTYEKRSSVFR